MFETFAGIGAQHKAITNIKKGFKVVGTSEWDVRAMIAYSQIHHQEKFNKKLKKIQEWSLEEIDDYLFKRTFSLNSKVPSDIRRKPREFKENVIAANEANNNYPNINELIAEEIDGVDLLTYSFPCQGLSIANMGRGKGIKPDSKSTSNLIWQIKRLLDDVIEKERILPKYLLMENVNALISKKHYGDYKNWTKYLKSIGYKTFTFVLNGFDHGSLQKRKRVFAISIKKEFALNLKWKDKELEDLLKTEYGNKKSLNDRKKKYNDILNSSPKNEIKLAIPNNTESRRRMARENYDLNQISEKKEYTFNTLTTKQDRHPNIGMIEHGLNIKGKLNKRFITPREGYQIMGFESDDYSKVYKKYGILTKESLYRQGGNSIVVEVLESIFKFIRDVEKGIYE